VGWYCGLKIVGTYGGAYGGPCCGAVRWGGTVGRYCGGVRKTKCLPVMFFYSLASNIQ